MTVHASAFRLYPEHLAAQAQLSLVQDVLAASSFAPFYRSGTPSGKPMSVEMTNLGQMGWVSDRSGYRYQAHHPVTGRPWPSIPASLQALWRDLTGSASDADSCLVNLYRDGARMGLHQDRDEADLRFPVLSVSLGDTAVFRIGGAVRQDPTRSVRLTSGDVCILAGADRLAFHGIDRVLPGTSRLVPGGGRMNLTLRRATMA
jgi:alkylated DNA repair protein (DNA oxidative demethylase)